MRISDWSSDVCSSDLEDERGERNVVGDAALARLLPVGEGAAGRAHDFERAGDARRIGGVEASCSIRVGRGQRGKIGRAVRRERVWQYVYVAAVALSMTQKTCTSASTNKPLQHH